LRVTKQVLTGNTAGDVIVRTDKLRPSPLHMQDCKGTVAIVQSATSSDKKVFTSFNTKTPIMDVLLLMLLPFLNDK
jgi:hypothetical protein